MRYPKCRITKLKLLVITSAVLANICLFVAFRTFYFPPPVSGRVEQCPFLTYPDSLGGHSSITTISKEEDVFWNISNDSQAVIFSAFETITGESSPTTSGIVIRVLGADVTDNRPALYCQLWNRQTRIGPVAVVGAIETTQSSSNGNTHVPVSVDCAIPPGSVITAVSITSDPCTRPQNLLQVHKLGKRPCKKNFTICYAPIQFNYNRPRELIESVERNRKFGADFFIFYNISHSSDVGKVMEYYAKKGLAEVVQWPIPLRSESTGSQIHYGGQTVAMNDCLYRYVYFTRFMVFTDIDEVIVPAKYDHWQPLIDELVSSDRNIKTFTFRNVMVWKNPDSWEKGAVSERILLLAKELDIISLLNFDRSDVYSVSDRTKVIVDPRSVDIMEIHSVNTWRKGASNINVAPKDALLYHYRKSEIYGGGKQRLFDYSMLKYADEIISRFKTIYKEIFT